MARLPRESIHMTAGRKAVPSSAAATVPDHCAVQPTPTTRSTVTSPSTITRRVAETMALHQAAGSCSAPPPGRRRSSTGSKALAAILPVADTSATLGPPVPRSTARTWASWPAGPPTSPRLFGSAGMGWQPIVAPRARLWPVPCAPAVVRATTVFLVCAGGLAACAVVAPKAKVAPEAPSITSVVNARFSVPVDLDHGGLLVSPAPARAVATVSESEAHTMFYAADAVEGPHAFV